jgi:NitT/TauT family transport system ATP-binding protein
VTTVETFQPYPDELKHGLIIESVSFGYDGTPVLENINLSVREAEFLILLGPSGSGKTTMLRLLAGLETPASGRVICKGKTVECPSTERGMVFQDYTLFPWMNLMDNVILAISKAHPDLDKSSRRHLAEEYLIMVDLYDARQKHPYELSGGMRQRGVLARTLAMGPQFMLMDEPFGALDPINRTRLQDLVLKIWSDASPPKTIVFVTHDTDEALYLGDRVVMLGSNPGRIIAEVSVESPRPRSRHKFFQSRMFQELSDQVLDHFRRDVIDRLESVDTAKGYGEGI